MREIRLNLRYHILNICTRHKGTHFVLGCKDTTFFSIMQIFGEENGRFGKNNLYLQNYLSKNSRNQTRNDYSEKRTKEEGDEEGFGRLSEEEDEGDSE